MTSSYRESFDKKDDELTFELDRKIRRRKQVEEVSGGGPRYQFRLGREPIQLSLVEYKIIRFLSAKPYKAFPRDVIVKAVHSEAYPVTDDNLDQCMRSLRSKLGLFSDYIQTVPYIGFRFKP